MKIAARSFILIAFFFCACKKDSLSGDNLILIGTWNSVLSRSNCGVSTGRNTNLVFKIEMIERGKYKLYQNGRKVESGRLLIEDGFVTFKCNEYKNFLNGRKILRIANDTFNVGHNKCYDDSEYTFVRD